MTRTSSVAVALLSAAQRMRGFLPLLLLVLAAAGPATQSRLPGVTAEGGDFRAELPDGQVLRGADLVGRVLEFQGAELRVDAARPDDAGKPFSDVWLFRLAVRGPDGEWSDACGAAPREEVQGMVFPGPNGSVRLTCSSGAIGTCIRFGYRPWARSEGGVPLAPYHRACVNLLRAAERDSATVGIEIYDRIGIRRPAAADAAFEAGWTTDGAVCLAHPRIPENDPQAEIAVAILALAGRAGREDCTEERAAALGALVFNRSLARVP